MTEISEEIIRAAQKHDRDNRGRGDWQSVPDRQARRLIEGALAAVQAEEAAESASAPPPEAPGAEKCRAVKHGGVDLHCRHPEGHDEPKDGNPGTWHEAVLTERREIDYDGAHHLVVHTETVTWEPADHIGEALRHIMAGRNRKDS